MQPGRSPAGTVSNVRRLRLRYAGSCAMCGTRLAEGDEALYDPATKTVRCVACPTAVPPGPPTDTDAGVAGRSARREYERRKMTRAGRITDRLGRRLGRVVLAVAGEPQPTRAWAKGARGEEALAAAVAEVPGVVALHDRDVPGTSGNLDHLVIAPAGVFVVDAKR